MTLSTCIATADNYDDILSLTNDAFQADAFFKKEEYHLRFDLPTVREMIQAERSVFILAKILIDDVVTICGSIFFHWDMTISENNKKIVGKFSAVSVPTKYGNRGIGKALVKAAEDRLRSIALEQWEDSKVQDSDAVVSANMEMGVINQRKDLFPWYEAQGYRVVEEIRPNDAELTRICLEGVDICCVLMRKNIL